MVNKLLEYWKINTGWTVVSAQVKKNDTNVVVVLVSHPEHTSTTVTDLQIPDQNVKVDYLAINKVNREFYNPKGTASRVFAPLRNEVLDWAVGL